MYSKDDPFHDPVVRCDSCKQLLFVADLKKTGKCECGNRKVRNVLSLSFWEIVRAKTRKIDPEFLRLFEISKPVSFFATLFSVRWRHG